MVDRLERFVSSNSSIYGEDFNRTDKDYKLNRGEQSVMGYFPSSTKAQKALQQIKSMGFEIAQMDRVSMFGESANPEIDDLLRGEAASQAGLSLNSSGVNPETSESERVLLAAHPSVSGMAAHDYGAAGGESFLVTVVADSSRAQEVVEVIKQYGGRV